MNVNLPYPPVKTDIDYYLIFFIIQTKLDVMLSNVIFLMMLIKWWAMLVILHGGQCTYDSSNITHRDCKVGYFITIYKICI